MFETNLEIKPFGDYIDIYPFKNKSIEVFIKESVAKLSIKTAIQQQVAFLNNKNESTYEYNCLFSGSTFIDDDFGENRFAYNNDRLAVSSASDCMSIPICLIENKFNANLDDLDANKAYAFYTNAIKLIQNGNVQFSPTMEAFSRLFIAFGKIYYNNKFKTIDADAHFDIITISNHFFLQSIQPLPIIETALSKNLNSSSNFYTSPKTGFCSIYQEKNILLIIDSDPKRNTLPLAGIWISGIQNFNHPLLWLLCIRYMFFSNSFQRYKDFVQSFVLVHFPYSNKTPMFYMCTPSDSQLEFMLLTGRNKIENAVLNAERNFFYHPQSHQIHQNEDDEDMMCLRMTESINNYIFIDALKNERVFSQVEKQENVYSSNPHSYLNLSFASSVDRSLPINDTSPRNGSGQIQNLYGLSNTKDTLLNTSGETRRSKEFDRNQSMLFGIPRKPPTPLKYENTPVPNMQPVPYAQDQNFAFNSFRHSNEDFNFSKLSNFDSVYSVETSQHYTEPMIIQQQQPKHVSPQALQMKPQFTKQTSVDDELLRPIKHVISKTNLSVERSVSNPMSDRSFDDEVFEARPPPPSQPQPLHITPQINYVQTYVQPVQTYATPPPAQQPYKHNDIYVLSPKMPKQDTPINNITGGHYTRQIVKSNIPTEMSQEQLIELICKKDEDLKCLKSQLDKLTVENANKSPTATNGNGMNNEYKNHFNQIETSGHVKQNKNVMLDDRNPTTPVLTIEHKTETNNSFSKQATLTPKLPTKGNTYSHRNQNYTQSYKLAESIDDESSGLSDDDDGDDGDMQFLKTKGYDCRTGSGSGGFGSHLNKETSDDSRYLDSIFIKDGKEVTFMKPFNTKLKVPEHHGYTGDSSANSVLYTESCLLPKLQYTSMYFDEYHDKNASLAINALAMKYLSDEQLTHIAKKYDSDAKAKRLNHIDENEEFEYKDGTDGEYGVGIHYNCLNGNSTSETIVNFNNVSFASKAYLQKHGLMPVTGKTATNRFKPNLNSVENDDEDGDDENSWSILSKPNSTRIDPNQVQSRQYSNEQHRDTSYKQQPQLQVQQNFNNNKLYPIVIDNNSPKHAFNHDMSRKETDSLTYVSDENYDHMSHILDFESLKKLPKLL